MSNAKSKSMSLKENNLILIMLVVKEDYTREVIGIINIPSDSATGWKEVLESIKGRGVKNIVLIIFDNLTGLDTVVPLVFKDTTYQKFVVHLKRNISNKVTSKHKEEIMNDLKEVFILDITENNIAKYIARLGDFADKWRKVYKHIGSLTANPMNALYFAYTLYHPKIRRMIYTTNWIERLNKEFRRTLKIETLCLIMKRL